MVSPASSKKADTDTLLTDVELQAVLQHNPQAILSNYAEINVQHKRQPSVPIANLLASAVAKDRVWVGYACVKALAVALGKGIVLICKSALILFTKDLVNGHRSNPDYYAKYPIGYNTRSVVKRDVPIEALHADTCFLVWNGSNHFWAAVRCAPPPDAAVLQQIGVCIDRGNW